MKKERLTSRYIEHDILHAKTEQRFRLTEHFICYFVPLLMIAVILSFFVSFFPAVLLIVIPIALVCGGFLIWYIRKRVVLSAEMKAAARGEYTVTREPLTRVAEETVFEAHSGFRHTHATRRAEFLYFSSQKWRIPDLNYTWSKEICLSAQSVGVTSVKGEDFFVVRLNSTYEVCCAYNTKFFEYTC